MSAFPNDPEQQFASLRRLGLTPPIPEQRRAAAQLLEKLSEDQSEKLREAALKTLVHWGDRDSVPVLLKVLAGNDANFRNITLEALAAIKDPRAAEPIANLLNNDECRRAASAALQALGKNAEKAVLPLLKSGNRDTQVEACNILKNIGTGASVPALQEAANSSNAVVQFTAKQTLNTLLARINARE